jgi:hypothetical protein
MPVLQQVHRHLSLWFSSGPVTRVRYMSVSSGSFRRSEPDSDPPIEDFKNSIRSRFKKSRTVASDLSDYVFHTPEEATLVDSRSPEERERYSRRMMQRLDINVDEYAILNIHRIAVRAPVTLVFEELKRWSRDSVWWPNQLATLERVAGRLEHIRVFFLGRKRHPLGFKIRLFGFNVIPLFELHATRIRETPGPLDCDNARYLLFDCRGGYPAGILAGYVRSPIADQEETQQTQLFFAVGFNFYGKAHWRENHIANKIWEKIHNRVTANVLNRFKRICEARFQKVLAGEDQPLT